jgi:hypothetical protein
MRLLHHTTTATVAAVLVGTMAAGQSYADTSGIIDTDRFGYDGTIQRYDTLGNAQNGTGATDTINVTDRDAAIKVVNDYSGDHDQNIVMGSWWYSTSGNGAGWGNTTGNTGVGFMQLFDDDGSTDTSVDMSFSDYDGTHYTQFNVNLTGENTNADDHGRLSAIDNNEDGGIWHSYELDLTAKGLEGNQLGPGHIEANNHPTDVEGSFTGVFEITEDNPKTTKDNTGFYTADFQFNMDNWAWDNRSDLTYPDDGFADSSFVVTPLPTSAWMGLSLLGLLAGGVAWRRFKAEKAAV